ncbi:unnamed protein product [Fraxinus pennsylvanica]|uniref:F-box domain-containing protein n=1 Tax=Fraxinus pennsylvanica TaxID=56036 RepID=A0AAD1ZPQ2_9LAMI|nr:unnamed protein product [Fraxinus pennsylvanica]
MAERLLNDYTLEEILLQLPLKYLMQFKCVCKSWYNLIANPSFVADYYSRKRDETCFFMSRLDRETGKPMMSLVAMDECVPNFVVQLVDLEVPPVFNKFTSDSIFRHYFGLLHGIVCYASGSDIALWNPCNKECKTLPPSLIPRLQEDFHVFSPRRIGFGFDFSKNFKILQVFTIQHKQEIVNHFEIYNLSTNTWRVLEVDNVLAHCFLSSEEFTSNKNGSTFYCRGSIEHDNDAIVSFNFCDEGFKITRRPPYISYVDYDTISSYILPVKESVILIYYTYDIIFEAWLLNRKGSWTYLFPFGCVVGAPKPLCLRESTELVCQDLESGHLLYIRSRCGERRDFGFHSKRDSMFVAEYKRSLFTIRLNR